MRWTPDQLLAYELRQRKPESLLARPAPAESASLIDACAVAGMPAPVTEYQFAPPRRWRFDFAWPAAKLALEVQGGIWTQGRHTRGAALLKEWEKLNTAAALGWRVLFCQPQDVTKPETVEFIRLALTITQGKELGECTQHARNHSTLPFNSSDASHDTK